MNKFLAHIIIGLLIAFARSNRCEVELESRNDHHEIRVTHNTHLKTLLLRWAVANRSQVWLRKSEHTNPLPSCSSLSAVFARQSIPSQFYWSLSQAVMRLGSTTTNRTCSNHPFMLTQRMGRDLTIDCFFRGIGDSVITFMGESHMSDRCVESVNVEALDAVCWTLSRFSGSLMSASYRESDSNGSTTDTMAILRESLSSLRRVVSPSSTEEDSETEW